MTSQQRRDLDTMIRSGPMVPRGDLAGQRVIFTEMVTAQPLPPDVRTTDTFLDPRLAPENPYPDALDDAVAAYRS